MSLAGRRIALVGGAGFIGHHLALALAAEGADVHVVDGLQVNNLLSITGSAAPLESRDLHLRMLNDRIDLIRAAEISLHVQDARDYHALSRLLSEISPQVIVHAAAVAHAGQSNKDPYTTFDHSLRTLENALDWSRGVAEHFVFLSSSMVYGNFLAAEVTEDHPLNPIGIYGALKVAGEKIVIAYNQVFDLPYTIVRPSALYGPRCISRRVAQIFIENALRGEPLEIEGDGSDRLDFTYIDDLVAGLVAVLSTPGALNETLNLTYGSARSIADVATLVQAHVPGTEIAYKERDRLMPERGTLSVEKARELIGYDPQNPIEIGVARYVEWYRSILPSRIYA
ncbi:MAG: NAD-dependent epimerase/dehydratase family protein [Gaiellaceae bacterium]